jgi:hypothetical protein
MSAARSDGDPVKLYERIVGRPPSAEQADRIRKLGTALFINNNDALWSILVALEYHQSLYAEVPAQIAAQRAAAQKEVQKIAQDAMSKSVAELRAANERAGAELTSAIARRVAVNVSDRKWLFAGAVSLGAVAFVLVSTVGFQIGVRSGRAESLLEAKQLAGWAESQEGRAAKALSDSGELGVLLRCDRAGWEVVISKTGDRVCFPSAEKKKNGRQSGWVLPPDSTAPNQSAR